MLNPSLCIQAKIVQPVAIVTVVANEGQRIDIPDGCVLENRESTCYIPAFVRGN